MSETQAAIPLSQVRQSDRIDNLSKIAYQLSHRVLDMAWSSV
jgi:hypothetical protein